MVDDLTILTCIELGNVDFRRLLVWHEMENIIHCEFQVIHVSV